MLRRSFYALSGGAGSMGLGGAQPVGFKVSEVCCRSPPDVARLEVLRRPDQDRVLNRIEPSFARFILRDELLRLAKLLRELGLGDTSGLPSILQQSEQLPVTYVVSAVGQWTILRRRMAQYESDAITPTWGIDRLSCGRPAGRRSSVSIRRRRLPPPPPTTTTKTARARTF